MAVSVTGYAKGLPVVIEWLVLLGFGVFFLALGFSEY